MKNELKGKTILVTGGTGSIGREIVKQILKCDIEKVIVFSRDEIKQFLMRQEIDDDRLDFIMGDIRNYESIESVFERNKVDMVFHAAAMKHLVVCEEEPIECSNTNITGTHNLMRLCIKYKVSRVITISTDKAASPTSVMGASKFIAERITLNATFLTNDEQKFCCVRFGNVANSRGSVIPIMVKRVIDGKDIWVSNPDVTRFIMRISDAVELVLKAAEITQGGEIFVLKMKSFRLGDLANVMKDRISPLLEKKIDINYTKLVTGEKLHEDLLNKIEYKNLVENEGMYIVLSNIIRYKKYPDFKKSKITEYDSSSVQQISLDELEEIVLEYLKEKSFIQDRDISNTGDLI